MLVQTYIVILRVDLIETVQTIVTLYAVRGIIDMCVVVFAKQWLLFARRVRVIHATRGGAVSRVCVLHARDCACCSVATLLVVCLGLCSRRVCSYTRFSRVFASWICKIFSMSFGKLRKNLFKRR